MKKLSREEMKNVMGGYTVSCFTQVGYTQTAAGSCSGGLSACQRAANNYCQATAGCTSCSVGGIR